MPILSQLPPGLQGYVAAQQMAEQRAANQLGQIGGILSLRNQMETMPLQRQLLEAQVAQTQNPAPLLKDLGGEIGIFNPRTFQQMGSIPKTAAPGDVLRAQTARETSVLNPDVVAARTGIAAAGKPQVDVRVDAKMGESFAKEIAPMMGESRAAAMGSVGVIDTVNRIQGAIEKGNVTLGPTATIRNKADQVSQLLGVGGATTEERLINTRNVIRGLSQFAVGARKQLKGQGAVSDYEGKLIQRAEAGEIDDFTLPELRDFVKVTDRLARLSYGEHQRMLKTMQDDPNTSRFVPYYSVPDLPKPSRGVKRTGTYQGKKVVEYDDGTVEFQ